MHNYRILQRFNPVVRLALKHIPFTKEAYMGNECGTGYCPLGVALVLSGGNDLSCSKPTAGFVAREMSRIGLITANEEYSVEQEAEDFIWNYSAGNHIWKRYL